MSNLELLPPDVEMTTDLNLKIRIAVLAQVLREMIEGCGADDCEDSIRKGIIEYPIIDTIYLRFTDSDKVIRGEIEFCIDWEKLEFLAQTNEGIKILDKLDINKLISQQLDPTLCAELYDYVGRLKKKYNIVSSNTSYNYRKKYKKTAVEYQQTRDYLNHVMGEYLEKNVADFNFELKTAFKGLDGYLSVIMRK